jgi:Centromere DNA-binding protein complex CBF3 subunit, domain 2
MTDNSPTPDEQLPSPPRMILPSQLQQATTLLSLRRNDNNIDLSPPRMFLPAQLRRATTKIIQQTTKENTQLAYNPKIAEFKQFCDFVYQHTPIENGRYTVDKDKVEVFMHYQCYRNKIPSNRRAKANTSIQFRPSDFNEVLEKYGNVPNDAVIDDPSQGIGSSAIGQYKAGIKKLWEQQVQDNVNGVYSWNLVWTLPVEDMVKMVKSRGRRVDRKNFKEKMDHETTHYSAVGQVESIEKSLFEEGLSADMRKTFSSLRNRCIFLMTTHGILRGESVFKSELSDFFGVSVQKEDVDVDPLYIVVCQIATGKTNKDLKLYGRFARHKDPRLCAVASLAFYLLYRFSCTREFEGGMFDFSTNGNWFGIKLLVDLQSGAKHDYKKAISPKPYAASIKKHCKDLGIPTSHYLHIGRVLGSYTSEVNEDNSQDIRCLGNWDPTTQEKFYSTRLPMKILRSKAGFSRGDGVHINPRVGLMPSDELVSEIFPWVDDAAERVTAADQVDGKDRNTAHAFLRMLKHLRVVILQDAAVLLEDSRASKHTMLNLPVFKTDLFASFRQQMKAHLSEHENPLDASLEVVLPGVNQRLNAILSGNTRTHSLQDTHGQQLTTHGQQLTQIITYLQQLQTSMSHGFSHHSAGPQYLMQNIGRALTETGRAFTQSGRMVMESVGGGTGIASRNGGSDGSLEADVVEIGTGDAAGDDTHGSYAHANHIFVSIPGKFLSVSHMKRFWFGEGEFLGMPIAGGIMEMNRQFGTKWRKGLSNAELKRYSKVKIIMESLERNSGAGGNHVEAALLQFDAWWKNSCNGQLHPMVEFLKKEGMYDAKSRKKHG